MPNSAFRYLPEEILITEEQVDHMKKIFEVPLHEAIELTDDELDEDVTEGVNP
jgi:hypothetical protein